VAGEVTAPGTALRLNTEAAVPKGSAASPAWEVVRCAALSPVYAGRGRLHVPVGTAQRPHV